MRSVMNAHCFNHRDTTATRKCGCCLKPICDSCARDVNGTTACSEQCLERIKSEAEKAAQKAREEEERAREQALNDRKTAALAMEEEFLMEDVEQTFSAYKILAFVALGCAIFFGWDYLPNVITGNVETLWGKIGSAF